eukprot:3638432-Rhodomonas_salina.1
MCTVRGCTRISGLSGVQWTRFRSATLSAASLHSTNFWSGSASRVLGRSNGNMPLWASATPCTFSRRSFDAPAASAYSWSRLRTTFVSHSDDTKFSSDPSVGRDLTGNVLLVPIAWWAGYPCSTRDNVLAHILSSTISASSSPAFSSSLRSSSQACSSRATCMLCRFRIRRRLRQLVNIRKIPKSRVITGRLNWFPKD